MSVAALKNFLEVEQKQEISEDEWSVFGDRSFKISKLWVGFEK